MHTACYNNHSFQQRVRKSHTTGRIDLCVTLDMTVAERFNYVLQSRMASLTASGAVICNTLSCFPRIRLTQLRYLANTLRTTRTQLPYTPFVLICHDANRHYDHPYNSAQYVMSEMTRKL